MYFGVKVCIGYSYSGYFFFLEVLEQEGKDGFCFG